MVKLNVKGYNNLDHRVHQAGTNEFILLSKQGVDVMRNLMDRMITNNTLLFTEY